MMMIGSKIGCWRSIAGHGAKTVLILSILTIAKLGYKDGITDIASTKTST
jgi:hypothetical protein